MGGEEEGTGEKGTRLVGEGGAAGEWWRSIHAESELEPLTGVLTFHRSRSCPANYLLKEEICPNFGPSALNTLRVFRFGRLV